MASRKKIVFAINNLGMGGAENMVIEQMGAMNRDIFQIFFITILPNPKVNLVNKIASDVVYEPFYFSGLFDVYSWWKLWRFFRKEKFDAVITNLFNTNVIVRIIAVLVGVPVILANELNIYRDKKSWQIIVDKILACFTKKILVSSVDVLEFTSKQESIRKERFCLNYNAIPLSLCGVKKDRNKVLAEYNLPADFFYIVTAGRLIKQKGHEYLIEAAKLMQQRGISKFKILIFGQGSLEVGLKQRIISMGLENDVRLMGLNTMDKILAISDIFVLPSLWEGLSIALLQAMDSGSPIVATDVSGSREAILDGTSGLLIEPANSEKLAEALTGLIRDERLRVKIAEGAHEQVKKFSIEGNVRVIEKLILL